MLMPFLEFFQKICDIRKYPQRKRSKSFSCCFSFNSRRGIVETHWLPSPIGLICAGAVKFGKKPADFKKVFNSASTFHPAHTPCR